MILVCRLFAKLKDNLESIHRLKAHTATATSAISQR